MRRAAPLRTTEPRLFAVHLIQRPVSEDVFPFIRENAAVDSTLRVHRICHPIVHRSGLRDRGIHVVLEFEAALPAASAALASDGTCSCMHRDAWLISGY